MTTRHDAIAAICEFPAVLKSSGLSIRETLSAIPYDKVRSNLTVSDLREYLRAHPGTIDSWRRYSADKRTSSGWYLVSESAWFVGYIGSDRGAAAESFDDPATACATFILRELDGIRARSRNSKCGG